MLDSHRFQSRLPVIVPVAEFGVAGLENRWDRSGRVDYAKGGRVEQRMAVENIHLSGSIRIPVSGTVGLTATEMAVVETADFQRLRRVRQLGTVVFVHPGATHTRFEHSLGTLGKADDMLLALSRGTGSGRVEEIITVEHRKLTRMYALLHDITHVPFGHTIEDEFHLFNRHGKHAVRTVRLLGPESDIGRLLRREESKRFYDRLMSIYLWEEDAVKRKGRRDQAWIPLRPWLDMAEDDVFVQEVVSTAVCADVLDYVARDATYCNLDVLDCRVTEAIYLKRTDVAVKDKTTKKHRVFVGLGRGEEGDVDRAVLEDLVGLMDKEHELSERIYFDHEKLAASAMLARSVQEYDAAWTDELYLLRESDDSLMAKLCEWEREVVATGEGDSPMALARLLRDGVVHRTIAAYDEVGFAGDDSVYRNPRANIEALARLKAPTVRRDVEDRLAGRIGLRPGAVLIYPPRGSWSTKAAQARVEWQGVEKRLGEVNDVFVRERLRRASSRQDGKCAVRLFGSSEVCEDDVRVITKVFEDWLGRCKV